MKSTATRFSSFARLSTLCRVLLIALLPATAHAQTHPEAGLPFITNFSPKEYRAGQSNWAVVKDDRGVMYFGNSSGLLEYDGATWRLMQLPKETVVRSVAKAKDGTIYVGGDGDFGFLGIDGVGETRFISLLPQIPEAYREFADVWMAHIIDDGVYFLTNRVIFRWTPSRVSSPRNRGAADVLVEGTMDVWRAKDRFHVAALVNGSYYVRQWGIGLMRMENDSLRLVPDGERFADERIYVMLPYSNNEEHRMLVGTRRQGLFLYDGHKFQRFETEADDFFAQHGLYLPGANLGDGSIALGTTGGGIAVIDRAGRLLYKLDKSTGLLHNGVQFIYRDPSGTGLWLGLFSGIAYVETPSPLSAYGGLSGLEFPITDAVRHGGTLYVATNNGIYWLNANGTFRPVLGTNDQCYDLLSLGDELFATVLSEGLMRIDGERAVHVRRSINYDFRAQHVEGSNRNADDLFVLLDVALVLLRRHNSRWQDVGRIDMKVSPYRLAEDTDGVVWIGSTTSGCIRVRFNGKGKLDLASIEEAEIDYFGLPDGLPPGLALPYRVADQIYFATAQGVYRFDAGVSRFHPDSTFFGIGVSRNTAEDFAMSEDARGRVWLNFGAESAVARPRGDGSYALDKMPFLRFSDSPAGAIYPESDGTVWFGGSEALIRYDPSVSKEYTADYPALIRRVTVGEDSVILGGAVPRRAEAPFTPILSYSHNTLRFEYAAATYDNPRETRFQTFLEGFDQRWSAWSRKIEKEYTNLPHREYTFRVRAQNIYQHPSEEAVYAFSILPPWWRTWWAYLLYVLAGGGLLFGLVQARTSRLEDRSRQLEQTVQERTEEIRQQAEELQTLDGIVKVINREVSLHSVLEALLDQALKLFPQAQKGAFLIRDLKSDAFRYTAVVGYDLQQFHGISLTEEEVTSRYSRGTNELEQSVHIVRNLDDRPASEKFKDLPAPKSILAMNVNMEEQLGGVLFLDNLTDPKAFDASDLHKLDRFREHAVSAIYKARQKENVELLSEIARDITSSLDFDTIFHKVYENVNRLADATIFGVGIYHPDRQQIEYLLAIEKGKRYKPYTRDATDKNQFPVWCIENKKPVFINDVRREYSQYISEYYESRRALEDGTRSSEPQSLIYVPLLARDKVLGVITLQSHRKNAYTEYHLSILTTIATNVSVAIQNARLYGQTKLRAAELATVNTISQALTSQLRVEDLIQMVGDKMRELFKANVAYLALLDRQTNMIHFPYQFGDDSASMPFGEGLTSKIIQSGDPLLINKDVEKHTAELGATQRGLPVASFLGVPIPEGDKIIGVLSVQSTEQENRFNEDDQRLLATIASNVGVALHNASLFEEAQQSRAAAEEANEAKSSFLSTVSHELRTPLTSVLGFAKIIQKRLNEKLFPLIQTNDAKTRRIIDQVSENLGVVITEGERLTTLINNVLDLAKIEAGKIEWNMKTLAMSELIERAATATTSLFEGKQVKFHTKVGSDLPEVIGDEDKLIQVMINLLSNAVKFTDEGSVKCVVQQQKEEIVVEVIDTGSGIAEEDLPKVFEKFKQVGDTLTDKPKGTGLGLPICKEIVERHGGRIWVESKLGEGSTFAFSLPLQGKEASDVKTVDFDQLVKRLKEQVGTTTTMTNEHQPSILVVDDEEHIRSLLRQELSEAGYRVQLAENGREAIESIRKNRPDLVVLDVMMPEMNGFDVAAVLKNDPDTMDLPIIILSIVQDRERGYRLGVDRYLTKPIDTDALFKEIESLLQQGKSAKRVMVVDENASTVKTLAEVLEARGYNVVEANGKELMQKAISEKPDLILMNSVVSEKLDAVKSLRFEKGLENVFFLLFQ